MSYVEADRFRLRSRWKKTVIPEAGKVQVEISRELTESPGDVDVFVYDAANNPLAKTKVHIVCTICENNGGR